MLNTILIESNIEKEEKKVAHEKLKKYSIRKKDSRD